MVRRDAQPLHSVVVYAVNSDTVTLVIRDHDGIEHRRVGVPVRGEFTDGIGSHAAHINHPGETSTGPMSDPDLVANHIQPPGVPHADNDEVVDPAVEAANTTAAPAAQPAKTARKRATQ
jgi:hypothetical protein